MQEVDLNKLIIDSDKFLCYIADKETFDILYVSKGIQKLLGLHADTNYIGQKCYKVFQNLDAPCAHCANDILEPTKNIVRRMFIHLTQTNYILIDSLIKIDDKQQRLTVAFDYEKEQTSAEDAVQKITLESTLLKCVNSLREDRTLDESINNLLQVVCEYYNADRAFLSEIKEEENILYQSYEYSISTDLETITKESSIDLEDLEPTIEKLYKEGHLVITDIEKDYEQNSKLCDIMKRFNTKAMILMPLIVKEKIIALMGVDNPRIRPDDYNLLHSAALLVNDYIKKHKFQKELERLSYIDNLTKTYNRNKYFARLDEVDTRKLTSIGILHININGLKQINDLYGEDYGDYIIKEVANVLLNYIEEDIFRLSGDEFVAFCHNITKDDFDIITSLLRKKDKERKEFSFAVGSVWQGKKIDLRLGVNQASELMLAEKQCYYKDNPLNEVTARINPLSILLDEIKNNAFFIHLQPKVELLTEKIIGAEALIRKRDDKGKIIPPDKFIPIYEHEGTIRHVDFFVFEQVCILLKQLIVENKAVKIAVNFSRVTFMAFDIIDEMTRICKIFAIPHKYIKIEITESIDKLDFEFFEKKLHAIKDAGFDVSLDDFGAKHSNLLMLSMIDFTEVKIDKSLIDHMTTRSKNRTVVRNIVKTINELGSSLCLAEGIETEEQKIALQEIGCHYGQGYYFYKPMSVEDFSQIASEYDEKNELVIPKKEASELYFSGHSKEISALIDSNPLCMSLLNHKNEIVLCNQQTLKTFALENREEYCTNFDRFSPFIQPDGRYSKQAFNENTKLAREIGYLKFNWLHCDANKNEIPTQIVLERLNIMDNESKPYLAAFIKDLRPQLAGSEEGNEWADGYFHDEISDKTLFNSIADMSQGWFFALDLRTSNIQFFGKGKEILNLPSTKELYPDSFDIKALIHEDDIDYFYECYRTILKGIDKAWDARFNLPNGETRYYRTIYKTFFSNEQKPLFCIGRTFDVHDEKMLELLSQTDLLTNCFNKITTENLIKKTLSLKPDVQHAMFIFDIDNFKTINDTLGHQAGDKILTQIAENLQKHFREHDIIGRIGGDEFVIFLKNTNSLDTIKAKAETIIAAFKNTVISEDTKYKVSGSIGISLYPSDATNYEDLYKAADKALYRSKQRGKDCYSFFTEMQNSTSLETITKYGSLERLNTSYLDYEIVTLVFETLFNTQDFSLAIPKTLELISEKLSADRVYLLETVDCGKENVFLYEHKKPELSPASEILKNTKSDILGSLFAALYEKDILYFNDKDIKEEEELYQMMQIQKVKTVLLLETKKTGYPEIVIGLDDCKEYRIWTEKQINSLRHILKLLSIFIASKKQK